MPDPVSASEPLPPPLESGSTNPVVKRFARTRWQVGLRTTFLLTAAIAVWITDFVNRSHNAWLGARIQSMRLLANDLTIDDPSKIALVKLDRLWPEEHRWDLYLPAGKYRLCVATRDIDQDGLAPVVQSQPIEPGRHRLILCQQRRKDGWRVIVTREGKSLLSVEEPTDWTVGSGWSDESPSLPSIADQPAVLLRRRFMRPVDQSKSRTAIPLCPCEGILLWIEPVKVSNRES